MGLVEREQWKGRTVGVLGIARSGIACAEVLTQLGASVHLYDSKPEAEIAEAVHKARQAGATTHPDGAPIDYAALDILITSPGVPKSSPLLQNAVVQGVPVIGEIEAAHRIAQAPILAVTGTNGKTTTTVLAAEMLRAGGIETRIAGNIAAGELAMPLVKAAFETPSTAAIVAEISSFQLEWIVGFRPRVAALLNITRDHEDRQSWDEYVAAKWRIFENQGASDTAVLPTHLVDEARRRGIASRIAEFGGRMNDELLAHYCDLAKISLPGRHNRENIVAAARMAEAFGIGSSAIGAAAQEFKGVVHRLEYVATIGGVRWINNSMCTNLDAFEKSLDAAPGSKIVIMGGVFKGEDPSPLAQSVLRHTVSETILIGRSAPQIQSALLAAGYNSIFMAPDITEAVTRAAARAQAGQTVLLAPACASFDQFRDFEDRGDRFKAAVLSLAAHENPR